MKNYKFIKELIEIKSYKLNQNKEIIEYLIKQVSPYAKEVIRIKNDNDDRESLIVGLNTKLKDISSAVILSGHIDTVFADEKKYNTCPYEATLIDGKVYGLGAIDMKSFFACILNNIKELSESDVPIVIAISGDEETFLVGADKISQKLKDLNICPRLTIVGEPTNMKICTESKSCYEYEISVEGKSCHSSMPQNGINANYIVARIALYIEKLCSKYKGTTTTANIINGGEKVNVVSSDAKLVIDVRSAKLDKAEKILNKLRRFIKKLRKRYLGCSISIKKELSIPPLERGNSKLIKSICKEIESQEDVFTAGCEAGYFQSLGGDAIVFGVGDLSLAHKPNEFVNLAEFDEYNEKFMKVMKYISRRG